MLRYFLAIALMALLTVVPLVGAYVYYAFHNRGQHLGELDRKILMIDTVPQPRMIFIGGSNVNWNLQSPTMEQATGCNVVNAAMTDNYGMRFFLALLGPHIKEGDHVVVVPTYNQFHGNKAYGNPLEFASLVAHYTDQWPGFNKEQALNLFLGMYTAIQHERATEPKTAIERNEAFNANGDFIAHWEQHSKGYLNPQPAEGSINEAYVREFASAIKQLRQRTRVTLLPPAVVESYWRADSTKLLRIAELLGQEATPYEADQHYFVLPDTFCHDDFPYHLNRQGGECYTAKLIQALASVGE